jgi:Arc/MetJ family transcription regulator
MDITQRMRHAGLMRTMIDIEDDVLLVVKEIALQQKMSAGSVVSTLLRESLQPKRSAQEYRNGVPLHPCRRRRCTLGL